MTTPFKKAGYTKDTKFKVINDEAEDFGIYEGDIVWLHRDDGSICPAFSSGGNHTYFYLPGEGNADLEVYHDDSVSEEKLSSDKDKSSPTITLTHNLTIKGYTHVLTTDEMLEVLNVMIDSLFIQANVINTIGEEQ